MDDMLIEFSDELVTITDFENIEKLFVAIAKDAVNDRMIRRNIK